MNIRADNPQSLFSRAAILRLIGDLLAAELGQSRGRSPLVPGDGGWHEGTELGEGGLDLDSLERLNASTALSEFFHLSDYGAEDYLLTLPRLGDWCDLVAQSLAVGGRQLTFRTSGTTGVPKRCTHAVADLIEEVACWTRILGPVERIVSLVPSHHIYGTLFTALLPDRLRIDAVSARASTAALMRSGPNTLIVATPTLWAHVARACPALPPGLKGVSSTAPMPRALADQLGSQGLAELVEIYGSSETGDIGYRRAPDAAYDLLDVWRHLGNGEVVREGAGGPLRHRLMDHGVWCDDRRFRLGGRRDGAVQVGGTNVFPERVREVLLMHDAVADAAVRLDPCSGRLKAFLVPQHREEDAVLIGRLDRWCGKRLSAVERPRSFTLGRALPCTALGKPADW